MYGPGISPLLAVASLCALMETHTGDQQMLFYPLSIPAGCQG